MRAGSLPAVAASHALERMHPSLALRARLGSVLDLRWGTAALLVDAAMLLAASVAAVVGARAAGESPSLLAVGLFAALALSLYHAGGLYAPRLVIDTLDDARTVVVRTSGAAAAVLALQLVWNLRDTSQIYAAGTVRAWFFALVYVVAGRVALDLSQRSARRRGEVVVPTLVVGTGEAAKLAARRLLEHRTLGLLPVGFVEDGVRAARPEREDEVPIPVVGSVAELDRLAERYDATQIVVTASHNVVEAELIPVIGKLEARGVSVAYVPGAHEKIGKSLRVEHVGALPLVTAFATDPRGWQYAVKYALDRVVAGLLVALASPFLVGGALAVWLSLGRPIFFRQARVGRDGREFEMLKFRTMRGTPEQGGEADAAWMAAQLGGEAGAAGGARDGSDRRTPVGDFLRRTSLDELPQLLNVLKGDMSLVGPRPERSHYVRQFEQAVYRYGDRHRVKSGITGWAQVHGLRGNTSLADRAEWDNWYIENFSLWLDVKILLLTVAAVLRYARRGE